MKSTAIGLIALIFITGCGEKVQRKNENPNFWNENIFAQKSASEVLNIKYNTARVDCRLWSQAKSTLDLSVNPTDTISIDLLTVTAWPATARLSGSLRNHEVRVNISVPQIKIARAMELTNPETGVSHLAPYSPVAQVDVNFTATSAYNKITSKNSGGGITALYENTADVLVNISNTPSTADPSSVFRDYVVCTLNTELKPELKGLFAAHPETASAQ